MTTYRFTVSKPTPCPFSGMHHADGHLLVLDDSSLSFFAPAEDGTAGRQLTDQRPLKSDADREHVKGWLEAAVKDGSLEEVGAKPTDSKAPKVADTAKQPPAPASPTVK